MNFEWAELHIARNQLDAALGRYDRAIDFLNEIVEQIDNRSAAVDLLSNCHRLKAWHLSRAGLVDSAFAEWDLAIKTAVGPLRDFLRAERALERAGLNDHAGAASEANQVTTGTNLNTTTLMHLARVYSVSLRAVRTDERLDSKNRQMIGDLYADRAVSCLKRVVRAPSPVETLLQNLDDDSVFAELRESEIYKSWRDTMELNKTH
jgi:tetratricopeptide (TPR) repeat protein